MKPPRPLPTDIDIMAIARLLVMRSQAGEFGLVCGRPLPVWNSRRQWTIGDERYGTEYILDHWRAAGLALGEFPLTEIPPLTGYKFKRFPRLEEPFRAQKKPVVREGHCKDDRECFKIATEKIMRKTSTVPDQVEYTSNEVVRIASVSLRQLQWWDEKGVVRPHHYGHKRIYSREQVFEVMLLADFRRRGLSLQKIRRVLLQLRKAREEMFRPHRWALITESGRLSIADDLTILKDADSLGSSCVIVSLERLRERLEARPFRPASETRKSAGTSGKAAVSARR